MSLNWQFTDAERFKELEAMPEQAEWNDAFIWGCLMVDLADITEKNAAEWQFRYKLYTTLLGAAYYRVVDGKQGKPFIPTLDEVRLRVGLKTNCSTKSRAQFVKKVMQRYEQENLIDDACTCNPTVPGCHHETCPMVEEK